jgi:hypothetical protein
MDAVVVTRSVNLAAPPDRVWPLLSDTDRFNRLLGMSEVHYRPIDASDKSGARFVGETRAGGFKLTYDEFPFEWSRPRAFSVHRRMHGGPITSLTWRCTLAPSRASDGPGALEGGTVATLQLELVPRSAILRPVVWLNASRVASSFAGIGPEIAAFVVAGAPNPYDGPVSTSDPSRIEAAIARLQAEGVDVTLAQRLGRLVREGADADLMRIRPFEQADLWSEDRRATLRAFLRGVPAGLLEALRSRPGPATVEALREVLANREGYFNGATRAAAVLALGALLPAGELSAVYGAVADVDASVSLSAIAAIVDRADEGCAEALLKLLEDGSGFYLPPTRWAAARGLDRIRRADPARVKALLDRESDAAVRAALAPMSMPS